MKYIRTKDGRIVDIEQGWLICDLYDGTKELKQSYQRKVYKQNGDNMNIFIESFTSFDILSQANTIEELCDEFVSIFKDNDKFVETDFQMAQDRFTGLKGIRKPTTCYGAIWTDKGLIYVAKMNEEGELELL